MECELRTDLAARALDQLASAEFDVAVLEVEVGHQTLDVA